MSSEDQDASLSHPKHKRASKPKVRSGCFTCKARRVKCDEGKPACAQCTRTVRSCEGYRTPKSEVLVPKALAPAPALDNPLETQALEFFFIKTAPQLAGFFGGAFFQGSVLQVCLAEPAIRRAVSAIGALHEQTATAKLTIAGNSTAAATHIKSDISLLQAWRETNGAPKRPWGGKYSTFEPRFLETEIAPLLSSFNTNAIESGNGGRTDFLLNPRDEHGGLLLTNRFENLGEARVGLIDIITHATWHHGRIDRVLLHRRYSDIDAAVVSNSVQQNLKQWSTNVEDLIRRRKHMWNKKEKQLADVIRIIRLSTQFGLRSYQAENECEWDPYRSEYQELIRLAEAIFSDRDRFPDSLSRTLSLDFGMIFPLHAVAWKCRWPKLRRQGLDLLPRIPRREWLFEAKHYHQIFSRIMEMEEEHLGLQPGTEPNENWLPSEHVRIHHFKVAPQPKPSRGPPVYAVTFWSKPQGMGGPWSLRTELMHLESSQPVEAAVPTNMMGRNFQAAPELYSLSAY